MIVTPLLRPLSLKPFSSYFHVNKHTDQGSASFKTIISETVPSLFRSRELTFTWLGRYGLNPWI